MTSDIAPNNCPECGEPAYVGMNQVECTNPGCRHFDADCQESHFTEILGHEREGLTSVEEEMLGLDWEATPVNWTVPAFPVMQKADHWKSTLKALSVARTWQCDPLWIHQAYIGDYFDNGGVRWRVSGVDRVTAIISAIPAGSP